MRNKASGSNELNELKLNQAATEAARTNKHEGTQPRTLPLHNFNKTPPALTTLILLDQGVTTTYNGTI